LVISEPYVGQGLNPQLKQFWEQTTYKNRIAFLTGSRNTFDSLIESAKRLKAIQHIIDEMLADKVPASDPQFKQADELNDRILTQFLSAVKETFTTLYYPTKQGNNDTLNAADFLMKFESNKYNGEDQVLQVLKEKQKYTDDVSSDIFRRKVEQRLFTTPVMLWSEIKKRAAMNCQWQWHRRDALDALKEDLVHKEMWREDGSGYVDRSPPAQKSTAVLYQERSRDEDTGRVELKVQPVNGDTLFAEIGGEATTASQKVENGLYITDEMEVSFLAVDSTGTHPTGPTITWSNRVTLKRRLYAGSKGEKMLELKAAPNKANRTEIRYTTDGSDPKLSGGVYGSPVSIPKGSPIVLAYAECQGVQSEMLKIAIDWSKTDGERPIDSSKPAIWRKPVDYQLTLESYDFMDRLKRLEAKISGVRISVTGDRWAELTLDERVELDGAQVTDAVETLRRLPVTGSGQVQISAAAIHFTTGQRLLDWLNESKEEAKPGEVKQ